MQDSNIDLDSWKAVEVEYDRLIKELEAHKYILAYEDSKDRRQYILTSSRFDKFRKSVYQKISNEASKLNSEDKLISFFGVFLPKRGLFTFKKERINSAIQRKAQDEIISEGEKLFREAGNIEYQVELQAKKIHKLAEKYYPLYSKFGYKITNPKKGTPYDKIIFVASDTLISVSKPEFIPKGYNLRFVKKQLKYPPDAYGQSQGYYMDWVYEMSRFEPFTKTYGPEFKNTVYFKDIPLYNKTLEQFNSEGLNIPEFYAKEDTPLSAPSEPENYPYLTSSGTTGTGKVSNSKKSNGIGNKIAISSGTFFGGRKRSVKNIKRRNVLSRKRKY